MSTKPHLTFWADVSVDVIASTLTKNPDGSWSAQLKIDGLLKSVSDEKNVVMEQDEMREAVGQGRVDVVVVSGSGAKLSTS